MEFPRAKRGEETRALGGGTQHYKWAVERTLTRRKKNASGNKKKHVLNKERGRILRGERDYLLIAGKKKKT